MDAWHGPIVDFSAERGTLVRIDALRTPDEAIRIVTTCFGDGEPRRYSHRLA